MREIKFRIWHVPSKSFLDPTDFWITADFQSFGGKSFPLSGDEIDLDLPHGAFEFIAADLQPDMGNTYVFQQYTGLKDKNGKEIYEGDICAGESLESRRFTVEFQDGGFSFIYLGSVVEVWVHNTTTTSFVTAKYVQVVGNIFEGLDK